MTGGPSPPPAPDPNAIIQAQEQANRINQTSPFGSQAYGPNGLTTTLNGPMQGAANLAMNSANTPLHQVNNTQGFGALQQQILGNMMNRYGGGGGGGGQKMTPQGGSGPGQMPAPFQMALGKIWGLGPQGMPMAGGGGPQGGFGPSGTSPNQPYMGMTPGQVLTPGSAGNGGLSGLPPAGMSPGMSPGGLQPQPGISPALQLAMKAGPGPLKPGGTF